MIDKIIYSFFGLLDKFSEHLDRVFFPKPKKRKRNVKIASAIVIAKMIYTLITLTRTM